jgi:hypothetical protein
MGSMTDVIFRDVSADMLEKLFAVLKPLQPERLETVWTVDSAEVLLRDLAPSARRLIVSTAEAGGRLSANVLRGTDNKSLKGLTGPIGKALNRLARNEKLPSGLPKPVEAWRDPTSRSWERTGSFVMPPALVPVFQAAAQRIAEC